MKEAVKKRIDSLANRPEGLDIQVIIADMKRKESPLHSLVEWNKDKAHDIYLADRARELIREYWIAVNQTADEQSDGKIVKIRKYHSLPVGNDKETGRQVRRYFSIDRIRSEPPLMAVALKQALDDLTSFRLRYQHLEELSEVMKEIDRTLQAHRKQAPATKAKRNSTRPLRQKVARAAA